jgi:hypothetical protein
VRLKEEADKQDCTEYSGLTEHSPAWQRSQWIPIFGSEAGTCTMVKDKRDFIQPEYTWCISSTWSTRDTFLAAGAGPNTPATTAMVLSAYSLLETAQSNHSSHNLRWFQVALLVHPLDSLTSLFLHRALQATATTLSLCQMSSVCPVPVDPFTCTINNAFSFLP